MFEDALSLLMIIELHLKLNALLITFNGWNEM
jgi:hypothetical protein